MNVVPPRRLSIGLYLGHVLGVVQHGLALFLLFTGLLWFRVRAAGPYFTGFVGFEPAVVYLILWTVRGFGGARQWERSAPFLLPFIGLTLWAIVSIGWARFDVPAAQAALQTAVVGAVVVAFVTDGPPPGAAALALAASLSLSSAVAIGQVIRQGPIGLTRIGEYTVTAGGKYSTLIADSLTFLRPYGLTAHPNILAGGLTVALLSLIGLLHRPTSGIPVMPQHTRALIQGLGVTAALLGWAALLLTFSRAAWLGFAAGGAALVLLIAVARVRLPRRSAVVGALGAALILIGFVGVFRPFILSRTGLGDESGEQRSIADRALFMGYTQRMIAEAPVFGMGIGMNDWESAQMIVADPLQPDLVALPVHSVPLLILSELGLVGFGLWLASLAGAGFILLRYLRAGGADPPVFAMFAAFAALACTSLLDFYMWRHFPVVVLWYGTLGVALNAASRQTDPARAGGP